MARITQKEKLMRLDIMQEVMPYCSKQYTEKEWCEFLIGMHPKVMRGVLYVIKNNEKYPKIKFATPDLFLRIEKVLGINCTPVVKKTRGRRRGVKYRPK